MVKTRKNIYRQSRDNSMQIFSLTNTQELRLLGTEEWQAFKEN